jgi:lysozyme
MRSAAIVIDLYHGDKVKSFAEVKASGIIGVIHKCSQGMTNDPLYHSRRRMALDAGLLWGAYHFLTTDYSGRDQADHFLDTCEVDDKTLVALDWESYRGDVPTYNRARLFLEQVINRLGRKAKVYSGPAAKEFIPGRDDFFGSHDLWLAQYGVNWRVQKSWQYPWLWQYSDVHYVDGIEGHVDANCIVDPMTTEKLVATWAN